MSTEKSGPFGGLSASEAGRGFDGRAGGPQKENARPVRFSRELEEHADEVVAAYLAGIKSDDPNRAYRAADAWISGSNETLENVTAPEIRST